MIYLIRILAVEKGFLWLVVAFTTQYNILPVCIVNLVPLYVNRHRISLVLIIHKIDLLRCVYSMFNVLSCHDCPTWEVCWSKFHSRFTIFKLSRRQVIMLIIHLLLILLFLQRRQSSFLRITLWPVRSLTCARFRIQSRLHFYYSNKMLFQK